MRVFWSWQSDHPAAVSRDFVKGALNDAVETIAADLSLSEAERPDVDHDTKGEPGLVDIVAAIFKKIEGASAFVADVTPVAKTDKGKFAPNPNVMIELGYALGTIGAERIVLVANRAFGAKPEDLPFDLRHRRGPILYTLATGATPAQIASERKRLSNSLAEALRLNLADALARRDATAEFSLRPASASDAATWLEPGEGVEHQDFFNEGGTSSSWAVSAGPKAYLRICPTKWVKKPSRLQVANAPHEVRLHAFGRWRDGNGGANALGVVAVGMDLRQEGSVHAVTQWFDKTGEIWGFNSKVTSDTQGRSFLADQVVLEAWANSLSAALKLMSHFGAEGPFRVEAGLTGLTTVHWAKPITKALDPSVKFEQRGRDCSRADQVSFLVGAINALRDAFNQPHMTDVQVGAYRAGLGLGLTDA